MPCQGPCARSSLLVLILLALTSVVQLAPPGIPSAPSGEPVSAKSGDSTTTTKSIPAVSNAVGSTTTGSDLLDAHKLKFLAVCQASDGTPIKKGDIVLCDLYRNLTTVLEARKVTAQTVQQEALAEQDPTEPNRFCENLSPVLTALQERQPPVPFNTKSLEQEAICAHRCLPVDDAEDVVTLKPICRVLLWGFRQLLLPEQPQVGGDLAAVQAAEKIIPPLIDQGLKLEKVNAKADAATKPVTTAAKPQSQQTSATALVTPSTNSVAAVAGADKPVESAANAPAAAAAEEVKVDDAKKGAEDAGDDEDNDPFAMEQETKNQQNLEDILGEGGVKENLDTPDDEQGSYDSDEDPSMDVNAPTVGGAPKEMAVREQQQQQQQSQQPQPEESRFDEVQRQELPVDPFFEETDSNFFSYFLFVMFACIVCYVAYHNKSKLLALALEGRRSSTGRGGFSKGRKHTAAYRKLDSNLEEAIMSNSAASSRSQQQIIY